MNCQNSCSHCRRDFGAYRQELADSIVPYMNAARSITVTTSQMILIFILILILVDTLCTVLWMYLKRFVCGEGQQVFRISIQHNVATSRANKGRFVFRPMKCRSILVVLKLSLNYLILTFLVLMLYTVDFTDFVFQIKIASNEADVWSRVTATRASTYVTSQLIVRASVTSSLVQSVVCIVSSKLTWRNNAVGVRHDAVVSASYQRMRSWSTSQRTIGAGVCCVTAAQSLACPIKWYDTQPVTLTQDYGWLRW